MEGVKRFNFLAGNVVNEGWELIRPEEERPHFLYETCNVTTNAYGLKPLGYLHIGNRLKSHEENRSAFSGLLNKADNNRIQ